MTEEQKTDVENAIKSVSIDFDKVAEEMDKDIDEQKEELKQEAEESFEQYKVTDEDYVVSPYSDDMGEKMLMYNDEYYAEETYLRLYTEGYLASAEPREKRIEIDAKHILELQKDKGYLTDKVRELEQENEQIKNSDTLCKLIGEQKRKITELEAQIEKMKCCYNCANDTLEPPEVIGNGICEHCKNHDKWELEY